MKNVLDLQHYSFSYGDKQVLKDVSLCLREGEILGLLGENGSGKTTLLNSIYGFIGKADLLLNGQEGPNREQIQALVSYVEDSPNLLRHLSARQFLDFVIHSEKYPREEAWKEAEKLLALFKIEEADQNKLLKNYSFGMRKKIQLISELLLNKPLLMVDEPTNGLDIGMIIQLKRLFQKKRDKGGCALLISSHNTGFMEGLCDRVLLIYQGRIHQEIQMSAETRLEKIYSEVVEGQ